MSMSMTFQLLDFGLVGCGRSFPAISTLVRPSIDQSVPRQRPEAEQDMKVEHFWRSFIHPPSEYYRQFVSAFMSYASSSSNNNNSAASEQQTGDTMTTDDRRRRARPMTMTR